MPYYQGDTEHFEGIRDMLMGNVDVEPTDDELRTLMDNNPRLVAVAQEFSWNETEVRDTVCRIVEDFPRDRP